MNKRVEGKDTHEENLYMRLTTLFRSVEKMEEAGLRLDPLYRHSNPDAVTIPAHHDFSPQQKEAVYMSVVPMFAVAKVLDLLHVEPEEVAGFLKRILANDLSEEERHTVVLVAQTGYEAGLAYHPEEKQALERWGNTGIFGMSENVEEGALESAQLGAYVTLKMLGELPEGVEAPKSQMHANTFENRPDNTPVQQALSDIARFRPMAEQLANASSKASAAAEGRSFEPKDLSEVAYNLAGSKAVLLAAALIMQRRGESYSDEAFLAVLEQLAVYEDLPEEEKWIADNSAHFTWQATQAGRGTERLARDIMKTFTVLAETDPDRVERDKDSEQIKKHAVWIAQILKATQHIDLQPYPALANAPQVF